MSFDSTAVVNLLATASATSEIRAGELPCGAKMKEEKKRRIGGINQNCWLKVTESWDHSRSKLEK